MPHDWSRFKDVYHHLLTTSWRQLVALMGATYLIINSIFAELYLLGGPVIENADPGFRDAFFFGAQTLSTVGYGRMSPIGIYANLLSCLEAFIGLLGFAMASGLMFAKYYP